MLQMGATLAGVLAATVALGCFAFFVRELSKSKLNKSAGGLTLGILFGTDLLAAPLGQYVLSQEIWPWFLVGEVIVFSPAAIWIVYKYALLG